MDSSSGAEHERWVVEDPWDEGLTFVPTGPWSPDTSAALTESGVGNLEINTARGFRSPSLEFIGEWPIRRLLLLDIGQTDVSPLARLRFLEELRLEVADEAALDLARFPKLRVLATDWPVVADSIQAASAQLRDVRLSGYDGLDLGGLASLTRLEALELAQPKALESLAGIEWPSLRRLSVAHAPGLSDLRALSSTAFPALEELEFEACGKVQDLSPVAGLRSLKRIGVNDCKHVNSIVPLRGLEGLEVVALWGSTVITDNDLSVLLELPRLREVRIADRRSYRPKRAEIEQHLAHRSDARQS